MWSLTGERDEANGGGDGAYPLDRVRDVPLTRVSMGVRVPSDSWSPLLIAPHNLLAEAKRKAHTVSWPRFSLAPGQGVRKKTMKKIPSIPQLFTTHCGLDRCWRESIFGHMHHPGSPAFFLRYAGGEFNQCPHRKTKTNIWNPRSWGVVLF